MLQKLKTRMLSSQVIKTDKEYNFKLLQARAAPFRLTMRVDTSPWDPLNAEPL